MTSLSTINDQIKKSEAQMAQLRMQADALRADSKRAVIAEVMAKIDEYGLSALDLRLVPTGKSGSVRKTAKNREKAPVRYRSPSGETWSGGRGRKPGWITTALAEGKDLEQFAVK